MSVNFKLFRGATFPLGLTLATGTQQVYAGPVASSIFFEQLLDNVVGVQLVSSDQHNGARQYFNSWVHAEGHPLERLRYRTVTPERWNDDCAVLKAIDDALAPSDHGREIIMFRDLSQFAPLLPGAQWLHVAEEVAATLSCPFLIPSCYGHHPAQRPDLSRDYRPARVLEIKAGSNLSATITDIKTGKVWEAKARNIPGYLHFNVEPAEMKDPVS